MKFRISRHFRETNCSSGSFKRLFKKTTVLKAAALNNGASRTDRLVVASNLDVESFCDVRRTFRISR